MKAKSILKNITGISCPIFGIQWNAPVDEINLATTFVKDLGDHRVLFNPVHMERSDSCVNSVDIIRQLISEALAEAKDKSPLSKALKRMRRACHAFQNEVASPHYQAVETPVRNSILERELSNLRLKFGESLAEISVSYDIDIEDELASIIPFNPVR
ncbi:DUF6650 family protein [Vibrio cholerae]|uniref:DUF6650 family protein n=1 Tax=Vibrio cholerae TaxID=666 RepID=UPI00115747C5|nr:DUF6650 family protein [Vibrio cholerae]TQQ11462.1 hypothetical protein FLL69_17185 [Vibrio cholerae]TQQ56199.1 hypothetical protein FLL63_18300 [Vibrio cholerae]